MPGQIGWIDLTVPNAEAVRAVAALFESANK